MMNFDDFDNQDTRPFEPVVEFTDPYLSESEARQMLAVSPALAVLFPYLTRTCPTEKRYGQLVYHRQWIERLAQHPLMHILSGRHGHETP